MQKLTGKERSYLAGLAAKQDAIFQIGKSEINNALIHGLSTALEARELIKISVLRTADAEAPELASELAAVLEATVVRTIGNKIILYRRSLKKDVKHLLPIGGTDKVENKEKKVSKKGLPLSKKFATKSFKSKKEKTDNSHFDKNTDGNNRTKNDKRTKQDIKTNPRQNDRKTTSKPFDKKGRR